jgi:hypothetical protein
MIVAFNWYGMAVFLLTELVNTAGSHSLRSAAMPGIAQASAGCRAIARNQPDIPITKVACVFSFVRSRRERGFIG